MIPGIVERCSGRFTSVFCGTGSKKGTSSTTGGTEKITYIAMRKFLISSSSTTSRLVADRRTTLSRRWLSSSPDSTVIDRELQSTYEGMIPRLLTLQKLLDVKGRSDFFKLHKQGVVSQESPLSAMAIYADLQNPLLTKYQFDAEDFMVGAKEAFKQVHMTIASADFFNYSNGFGESIEKLFTSPLTTHPRTHQLLGIY